ncbi:MAG: hypothetical protein IJ724_04875 [Muribaculaceae bacterium]|nr:hypothetical protein [Muribaculaceae bacterium]
MTNFIYHPIAVVVAAIMIVIVLYGFYLYQTKHGDKDNDRQPMTVDDYVAANGEPVDMVVLDATRCNELSAVILVYDHTLVVNGQPMGRDLVTNATFNNGAVPYVDNRYQIVLTTTMADQPTVHIPVGADAKLASEVLQQLNQYLSKP